MTTPFFWVPFYENVLVFKLRQLKQEIFGMASSRGHQGTGHGASEAAVIAAVAGAGQTKHLALVRKPVKGTPSRGPSGILGASKTKRQ